MIFTKVKLSIFEHVQISAGQTYPGQRTPDRPPDTESPPQDTDPLDRDPCLDMDPLERDPSVQIPSSD